MRRLAPGLWPKLGCEMTRVWTVCAAGMKGEACLLGKVGAGRQDGLEVTVVLVARSLAAGWRAPV